MLVAYSGFCFFVHEFFYLYFQSIRGLPHGGLGLIEVAVSSAHLADTGFFKGGKEPADFAVIEICEFFDVIDGGVAGGQGREALFLGNGVFDLDSQDKVLLLREALLRGMYFRCVLGSPEIRLFPSHPADQFFSVSCGSVAVLSCDKIQDAVVVDPVLLLVPLDIPGQAAPHVAQERLCFFLEVGK